MKKKFIQKKKKKIIKKYIYINKKNKYHLADRCQCQNYLHKVNYWIYALITSYSGVIHRLVAYPQILLSPE